MRLNEMKANVAGLPGAFTGNKKNWQEVEERFEILAACIIQHPACTKDGQPIVFQHGDRAGEPVMDRQAALKIKTESGKICIVRTNSKRIVGLFDYCCEEGTGAANRFGDAVFIAKDLPEGWLKFAPYEFKYPNGKVGDIADLIEAD